MAKDIKTIIALTNALYSASSVTSQAASRKAELEAERKNVQNQSTDIWTSSSLSSYIAGEKYDDEAKQERDDLDKLEKMLSEKRMRFCLCWIVRFRKQNQIYKVLGQQKRMLVML